MPEPHVLVLAVDGLRASALGAYGNTSFPTPALDRLAADGFLVDWCFAGSPELASVYRSLWQSMHVLRPENAASRPSLPQWFAERGYATTLLTDEPRLASFIGAAAFDERVELPGTAHDRADDVAETALARLMATACECIAQPIARPGDHRVGPQLVWIHTGGMYGPWDAPIELQESLLDEGDPDPYDQIEPPDVMFGKDEDPDTAFRFACAYAAQVMVLDACVDALTAAAHAAWPDGNWLCVLLGVRGFPLGEHGHVGGVDARLFAESLHVPWLVRFPSGTGRLARTGGLVSHVDLLPTLVEWIGGEPPGAVDGMSVLPPARQPRCDWRDAIISATPANTLSIRTPDWCLQQVPAGDESSPDDQPAAALYVRPDDRWEANDVAKLCPDVMTELTQVIGDVSRRIAAGEPVPSQMLPDDVRRSAE